MPGITVSLTELIELGRSAERMALFSDRKIFTQRAGGYLSAFRGRGMDFDEVRAYQSGDDIRSMDWRVLARTNEPHIKVYREEKERPVFIVADFSSSMFFGTQVNFKSVTAAQSSALLAWAAMQNGDRVGGICFNEDEFVELRPRARKLGLMPVLQNLVKFAEQSKGNGENNQLTKALKHIRQVAKPGSLIIVLSDFIGLDDNTKIHWQGLARNHDMLAVMIYDALEQAPPKPGLYSISDGEKITTMDTRNKHFCHEYITYFKQRDERVTTLCQKTKTKLIKLATSATVQTELPMLLRGCV